MGQFETVLILMIALAAASVALGWRLGYDARNRELTNEVVNEFRQKFLQKFTEEFERRVNAAIETETQRVHDELIELLEEERKKNEGTDSN
jgi:hypothetical protein